MQLNHRDDPDGFTGLMRVWDAVMLAAADRPLPAVVLEAGTVLRPPASAAALGRAAERVSAQSGLPASYAAFLAVSDGAYANGCGVVTRSGEYGLFPVDSICRVVDVAPDHVGLWMETFGAVEPEAREARGDGEDVASFAPFGRALLIAPMIDAICDCLVPVAPELDAGGEGFEVWETFKEGAVRFLTFDRWLAAMVTTHWVARRDELVRRVLPDVAEQLATVERWAADPDHHWFAVRSVRRLAAAPRSDGRVAVALDRLWQGDDPYLRLAAAQADLGHRPDRARERLTLLAGSAGQRWSEPTVALAASATLRACDHAALNEESGDR
jgi:hypothetical protein